MFSSFMPSCQKAINTPLLVKWFRVRQLGSLIRVRDCVFCGFGRVFSVFQNIIWIHCPYLIGRRLSQSCQLMITPSLPCSGSSWALFFFPSFCLLFLLFTAYYLHQYLKEKGHGDIYINLFILSLYFCKEFKRRINWSRLRCKDPLKVLINSVLLFLLCLHNLELVVR